MQQSWLIKIPNCKLLHFLYLKHFWNEHKGTFFFFPLKLLEGQPKSQAQELGFLFLRITEPPRLDEASKIT